MRRRVSRADFSPSALRRAGTAASPSCSSWRVARWRVANLSLLRSASSCARRLGSAARIGRSRWRNNDTLCPGDATRVQRAS